MKENEIDVDIWHAWGRGEMHTGFWWGNLEEKGHLEDQNIGLDSNIKLDLQGV
jgi:hypothetical protein